jgi:hypothetical protein
MNDKDDDQWLATLAGKPDGSADSRTNGQAQAVRQAMLARREAIDVATEQLDPGEFERLLSRLKREGLLSPPRQSHSWIPGWLRKLLPMKDGHVAALPVWSLAVNAVLVVVVVLEMGAASPDADVLRGDSATVLRVADPQARLVELMAGLDAKKARYVVQRTPDGELTLLVQADDNALDYLIFQRLGPQVKDGVIVIRLKNL